MQRDGKRTQPVENLFREDPTDQTVLIRTEFDRRQESARKNTDRLFAGLMILEWLAAVAVSYWHSGGSHSVANTAVAFQAPWLGAAVIAVPVGLTLAKPGQWVTRHMIAIGQLLLAALLVQMSGALSSHLHIFGSLALLMLYRDWRVLITGSLVMASSHLLLAAPGTPFHAVEYVGWILFEDIVLFVACRHAVREVWNDAERQARLEHESYCDPLTGLPNRLLFQDRLSQALALARRQNRPLAVLHIDLDRFKQINDTLDHPAGDALLSRVAQRLAGCLRESDTLARMGGDEFGVVLTGLKTTQDAGVVAEKLLEVLKPRFVTEGHDLFISASIGIALSPGHGEDALTLQKNAERAMYRAKSHGRNCHEFFHNDMDVSALERLELESDLHVALEHGEFELHYQPEVDLAGHIVVMEALLRWKRPQRGIIPPDQFIPIAEETGLILPIGEWVLQEACRQNVLWQKAGLPRMKVAVNVSAVQFDKPGFAETVARAIARSGLDSQYLELELTETVVMRNLVESAAQMARLRSLGVSISIDDFGTGYSSLSYLRQLPVDNLKIDRSFVCQIEYASTTVAMLEAIVRLAHGLGLEVVAEGVETEQQCRVLWDLGCDKAQGFLLSRPLPTEAAERLLRNRSRLVPLPVTQPVN